MLGNKSHPEPSQFTNILLTTFLPPRYMGQCPNCKKHVGPKEAKVETAFFAKAILICCPHCDVILGAEDSR